MPHARPSLAGWGSLVVALAASGPGCVCRGGSGEIRFPDASESDAGAPVLDAGDAGGGGSDAGPALHTGPLPEAIFAASAAFADRKLWVIGGNDGCGSIDRVYYFDWEAPEAGWQVGPPAPQPVAFGATESDGARIFIGGGLYYGWRSDDVLVLDAAERSWTFGPSFQTTRSGMGAGWSGGQLLFMGGLSDQDTVLDEVWALDPVALTLAPWTPLPEGHAHEAVAGWNQRVYVISGIAPGGGLSAEAAEWSPLGGWEAVPPLPTPRKYAAGVALGGRIVVLGGQFDVGEPTGTAETYDPVAGVWSALPDVTPVATAAAVAVGEAVYLIGGLRTTGATAEVIVVEPNG